MMKNVVVRLAFGAALAMAGVAVFVTSAAAAIDVPRWVAAIYVDGQRAVGLRWQVVPGAGEYKVLRSTTAGAGYAEIAASPQPQYFDKTVEPGLTYYYVLRAVAGAEVSADSAEKSVTIPGVKKITSVPPAWNQVQADSSTEFGKISYRVGLSWNKPNVGNPIAYNLYRTEVSGKDYQQIASLPDTTYVDAKVEVGKTYYYVLASLDESFQESAYSPERSVAIVEAKKSVSKKKEKINAVPLHTKTLFVLDSAKQILGQPRDLAVADDGSIFVSDAGLSKIVKFDKDNEFVTLIGEKGMGEGKMMSPSGIAIGPDDNLYVADQENPFIHVFTQNGRFVKSVAVYQHPLLPRAKPYGIDYDAKNDRWIVGDYFNHQIHVYDAKWKFQFAFGTQYDDTGKATGGDLSFPVGVKATSDGRVAVVDSNAHLTIYDGEGVKVTQIGERGSGVGTFMYPNGLAYEPKHNWLFVVDKTVSAVQVFDTNGKFKYALTNEDGKEPPGLVNPNGAKIVGDRIYVVENLAKRYTILKLLWDKSPPPFQSED